MLKILHTGDVHLDSPFSGLDPTSAEVRRNELRAAFTSMFHYARTEKVDMILIGPDECSGIESTIVDLTGEYPVITRPGPITIDDLQDLVPRKVFQLTEVPEDDSL